MIRRLSVSLVLILSVLVLSPSAHAASAWRGMTVDGTITDEQIVQLGSWGVNFVFYFLNPNVITETEPATAEAYMSNLEASFPLFNDQLAKFAAQGIKVGLNLYGPPGGFAPEGGHRMFVEPWTQPALVQAWQRLANLYAGNPNIWAFNLLNEPAQQRVASGLKNWAQLSQEVVAAIRAIHPTVRLIIQPPFGDLNRFGGIKPIKGDKNISYAFNMYYPWKFTHQGLYGTRVGATYPSKTVNRAKLEKWMNRAFVFQRRYKARLYITEFTAARWAPKNSAYRYLKDVIKIMEKRRIDWTYHSAVGTDSAQLFAFPWSVEHDSNPYNRTRSATETNRLQLLKSYFARNKR